MESTKPDKNDAQSAETVGAIDIGSNSLRMAIAEVLPDGRLEMLEQLQRAVRLGHDTFRRGRLRGQTMRAVVSILRDYRKLLDFYSVEEIRAVATSAVREASNSDTLLDRIFMSTGLGVEVIDTTEESRLTVSAFRHQAFEAIGGKKNRCLIADVGGGSTLLTVLERGEIADSQSLNVGSIRLQELLSTNEESPERAFEIIHQRVSNVVSAIQSSLPLKRVRTFAAIGGDARFAARQVGKPLSEEGLCAVSRGELDKLVRRCRNMNVDDLVKAFSLPFADAETINAALLVYQTLLRATGADEMIVSQISMRDGLLLDLARTVTGQEDQALTKGVLHSATALAEKYRVDLKHARNVADLAVRLYDAMGSEHGLGSRQRLLLRVAGLVHEVGGFVSNRAHHKHSYYVIVNSEVFGLSRDELALVAHVARYHRRSAPKPSHTEYMTLPREKRMTVSKLSALLRVADALDCTHAQQVRKLHCERRGEEFVLHIAGVADLAMERRSVAMKGDLFEDIYGLKVRLEEAAGPSMDQRRARAVE
jgi:exopolyphosphatase/guanosine-5'-triphosphate,3'-diphosphate pyrophosphatase